MCGLNSERRTEAPLLLRPAEAARLLSIGERSLWRLADEGKIPVVRIGRSVRYRYDDLLVWVMASKTTAKPETHPQVDHRGRRGAA